MALTEDRPHVLVITRIPGDDQYEPVTEYEVLHPEDCPVETWTDEGLNGRSYTYTYHTCLTGHEIEYVGLDSLSWDAELVPGWEKPDSPNGGRDWEGLPEGRYLVAGWSEYSPGGWWGGEEYDCGLTLLGVEDAS